MQYIDGPNFTPTRPACGSGSSSPQFFQNCSAPGANDGTVVTADWLNDIQGNMIAVLNAASVNPTPCRDEDLLDAINSLISIAVSAAVGSGPTTIAASNITGLPANAILMTNSSGQIIAAPTGYDFGSY